MSLPFSPACRPIIMATFKKAFTIEFKNSVLDWIECNRTVQMAAQHFAL